MTDRDVCRTRLLSWARGSERPRFDLIARGLAALGCTAEDAEVVDTLLDGVGRGALLFDPGVEILTHFSTNSRVRQYAEEALNGREPPLGTLARVYENDAEIRRQVLAYAAPLPIMLRSDIGEVASGEATSHPSLERVLEGYDIEVDGELKIAASIYYHRHIARAHNGPGGVGLSSLVCAVGPDLEERRAAAFAGMLLLGRVNEFVPMEEHNDKPLRISTGTGYGRESDSMMALVCERWEDLHQAFGTDFATRFGYIGTDEGNMWDCLAPHLAIHQFENGVLTA